MKQHLLLAVVLLMFLGVGACARSRVEAPSPPGPTEWEECNLERLQTELARYEADLEQVSVPRVECLGQAARVAFLLGELSPKNNKRFYFEKGRRLAAILAREQPGRAEGHYWLALNLCGLAELGGAREGLRLIPAIIAALEQALKTDPNFDQAGPHRVLGRIYFECPSWPLSVGDVHASLRHLAAAATLAPENSTNHLYLAETLFKLGKTEEARQELEKVLQATRHALCPQFLEEDRLAARKLLSQR
ncbi:MAG: tetratricopeptide repeat protein [Desulfobaccales bacterium]